MKRCFTKFSRAKLLWKAFVASFFLSLVSGVAQSTLVDPSFRIGAGANDPVNAILPRADGTIMVGGSFTRIANSTNQGLALLNSNGIPDPSFRADADDTVWHLAQQSDGKVLVAGEFDTLQGGECRRLGRLLTNGIVDSNFNGGTNFAADEGIFTIALQPDGKILVGTFVYASSRLLRLNPDGSLDDSFVNTNNFTGYIIHSLLVQNNGDILVGGGFSHVNGVSCPGLARLDANGVLVPEYTSPFRWYSDVFAINQLVDGKILVGGVLNFSNAPATVYVAKLTAQFEWETNFVADYFTANTGYYPTTFVTALALQPDGKMVVAGSFDEVGGYWRRKIARLDAQGRVDPCFDPGIGLVTFDWSQTVALQPDGRILVGGRFAGADGFDSACLARFLPEGDCGAIRVHLKTDPRYNYQFLAGTYPPGGTNYLQVSTNLTNWRDLASTTNSHLIYDDFASLPAQAFFRIKKTFQ